MAQSDDIARLAQIMCRDLVLSGRARQHRQASGLSLSDLGKASGATAEQVGLWEAGRATPSLAQSLAWLGAVTEKAAWREAAGKASA